MEVTCHCGSVKLMLPHAPDEILQCNCSVCRKSGFKGIYYREGEVAISGDVDGYVRHDMEQPCIEMWRCRKCGILTHWSLLDDWPHGDIARPDRMGVNARLLDSEVTDTLPIQHSAPRRSALPRSPVSLSITIGVFSVSKHLATPAGQLKSAANRLVVMQLSG